MKNATAHLEVTTSADEGEGVQVGAPHMGWGAVLCVGLSLSIGWGIRGNFGHEYGAMIPGALATLAAVLLAGRSDWHRRGAFFAFFGALGWSFGGSISYMQVIGYTHSGDSASVLYGFANLFVIGFLWAAMGGAGAALPACLSRERLTGFFVPLTVLFVAWVAQDFVVERWFQEDPAFRHQSPLYWYDTDWLAAAVAIAAMVILAVVRRNLDPASSLILYMAIGWWVGFLVLVNLLGWRMTPPRGDNWAGCVGMVAGMWVWSQRHGLPELTFASLISGLIGGFGFAFANHLKLVGISSGWQTNWHSLLEQSYGFINGLGLAAAIFWLARHAAPISDEPPVRKWSEPYAVGFVLLVLTYLNLVKNPEVWVKAKAMPSALYGLSPGAWFNLAWVVLAGLFVVLVWVHSRRPLPLLSTSWLAKSQMLYLVFLWVMVIGNFERALVSFAPQRLFTEGIIFLNAALCTLGIFVNDVTPKYNRTAFSELSHARALASRLLPRTILVGALAATLSVLLDWAVVRGIYGDRQAGYASLHIRFGPNATATKEKPKSGVPHP